MRRIKMNTVFSDMVAEAADNTHARASLRQMLCPF